MVDESHSTTVVGPTGHGVSELLDIYTGTLGKALGGAMAVRHRDAKRISTCCANASVLQFCCSCRDRMLQYAERKRCPA